VRLTVVTRRKTYIFLANLQQTCNKFATLCV